MDVGHIQGTQLDYFIHRDSLTDHETTTGRLDIQLYKPRLAEHAGIAAHHMAVVHQLSAEDRGRARKLCVASPLRPSPPPMLRADLLARQTALEEYFARSLGFALLALGLTTVFLSGAVPLVSQVDGTSLSTALKR